MGQCTSKHGGRKEGVTNLNDIRRNLVEEHQSSIIESKHLPQLAISTNPSQNTPFFVENQGCLSLTEEDTYSSDFCEEEESFTTANSSSRSMRNPTSRKTSAGASRKSSSVTPSSFSPNKISTTSNFLSPNDTKQENGGSCLSIHDVVKKPGCEMFVIDFEDNVSLHTSPKKRTPLNVGNNKKPLLSPYKSLSNSPKKSPKKTIRKDRVSDNGRCSSVQPTIISTKPPNNNKRPKLHKSVQDTSTNGQTPHVSCSGADQGKPELVPHKNGKPNSRERSIIKDIIGNRKFKKGIPNQTLKTQDSSRHTFLPKKSKHENNQSAQQNIGK